MPDMRPSYRSLLLPALKTAGVSLFLFALAHVLFITWAVDRSNDASLAARLVRMFFVPLGVGLPFALVTAVVGAAVWRNAMGTRLAGTPYGLVLATALLPPLALALAHGPYGDGRPAPAAVLLMLGAMVAMPFALAARIAGVRVGWPFALAPLPFALVWTMFILAEGVGGWVAPFVASILLIVGSSGALMARFAGRAALRAP